MRTLQEKGTLTGLTLILEAHPLHLEPTNHFSAGHTGAVYAVAVLRTPGRERLFSASYDKTIRVSNIPPPQLSILVCHILLFTLQLFAIFYFV